MISFQEAIGFPFDWIHCGWSDKRPVQDIIVEKCSLKIRTNNIQMSSQHLIFLGLSKEGRIFGFPSIIEHSKIEYNSYGHYLFGVKLVEGVIFTL